MKANSIIPGSLSAIAERDGKSLAETFMQADVVVIVDVSSSMSQQDSRDGKQRYEVATDELTQLQNSLPGKIAVIAFSDSVQFVPYGIPPFLAGSTDLAEALRFVKIADGCVRFIVISDGEPNDEAATLAIAKTFSSQIDVVFVGPDSGYGAEFLQKLAKTSGGQYVVAACAAQLAEKVETLLLNGR